MDSASILQTWLERFCAAPTDAVSTPIFAQTGTPRDPAVTVAALAALAAEALARDRTLWIVTADDTTLPDISNALDLRLRPLCLVMPGADYAGRIALRATLSLLKSRLARAAEDSEGPAWTALRQRLHSDDALWRAALAWSARGLSHEAPPAGIAGLFPVRIGPWTLAERLDAPADWVVLTQAQQLPATAHTPWPGAHCTLALAAIPYGAATGLAPLDETTRLHAELDVLGQELAEMELELATAQGELASFSERYHMQVAERMAELDRLHAELTRIRLQQIPTDPQLQAASEQAQARAEQSRREAAAHRSRREKAAAQPFAPGNDLKKCFRQLAQKIHPDRARDEADRAWRTQLMSEANRAYRAGDMAALEEVLAIWREGAHGAPPAPTGATTTPLAAQVARIRRRIAAIAAELDRLYGSKLYELFAAARVATRQGRDLLVEMAQRLDAQIAAARATLDGADHLAA